MTEQVTRLLQDAKAEALVANFAGQWLGIRAIADATPDAQTLPEFDEDLRAAMLRESERLFTEVIGAGAP